jgi:hypothetical protein
MLLLRKDSHALIQIFDLTILGRVPFMDFQCTQPIMPSWAVHLDTARREYLQGLMLVSAYVFVFWSKARRWNRQLHFEIGFHEANIAFVLEVMKSKSEDTFAGFYGIYFIYFLVYRMRRRPWLSMENKCNIHDTIVMLRNQLGEVGKGSKS